MAIASMDNLIAALPGLLRQVYKTGQGVQTFGAYTSLWTAAGIPGAAAVPSSGMAGDVPTSATAGAIVFSNPTAPALTYLGTVAPQSTTGGVLMIYDRLWQSSGISPTTTTAQTVSSVPLTRPDANGANTELWLQIYTVMGAAVPAITASYTNQSGTSGQTATAQGIVTAAAAGRCFPFSLASGDTGVRSIQTYTQTPSWVSGALGLVLRRRIATIPVMSANNTPIVDAIVGGMPQIYDNACIEFLWMPSSATTPTVLTPLSLLQG